MPKEKITKAEILEECGFKFQTMSAGYVDTVPNEMMLPAGFSIQGNGKIETPNERTNRLANNKSKTDNSGEEMMLPIGIKLEE